MTTIAQHFAVSEVKDGREVGVEIEMEGENLPIGTPITGWKVEADGSLRGNSCEMVLRRPEPRGEVEARLSALALHMKKAGTRLAETDRCGVHIHVNVQELSIQQTFSFILLYLLFEEPLVHYCGEEREGNLFCLRAKDAGFLLQKLRDCKKSGNLTPIANDHFRYASINMAALAKYGSLEFRALKTPYNIMEISDWANMILAIKDYAVKLEDAREIVESFSRSGELTFMNRVFGNKLARKLKCQNIETMLRDGARRIQDICYIKSAEYVPTKKSRLDTFLAGGLRPSGAPVDDYGNRRDRTREVAELIASGRLPVAEYPLAPRGLVWFLGRDGTPILADQSAVVANDLRSQNEWGVPNERADRTIRFAQHVKDEFIADPGPAPVNRYWDVFVTDEDGPDGEWDAFSITEPHRDMLVSQFRVGMVESRPPQPTLANQVQPVQGLFDDEDAPDQVRVTSELVEVPSASSVIAPIAFRTISPNWMFSNQARLPPDSLPPRDPPPRAPVMRPIRMLNGEVGWGPVNLE